jgi:hypothetical protein
MTRPARSVRHSPALVRALLPAAMVLVVACRGAASPEPVPSPIVAVATSESLRLTLTLEGPPRSGAASWASFEVGNIGDRAIRWAGGGCGDPGGIFIDLQEAFPAGRMDWPEPLGRFKRLALGPAKPNGLLSLGYTAEARWGHGHPVHGGSADRDPRRSARPVDAGRLGRHI